MPGWVGVILGEGAIGGFEVAAGKDVGGGEGGGFFHPVEEEDFVGLRDYYCAC